MLIQQLEAKIRQEIPNATFSMRTPRNSQNSWWLDIYHCNKTLTIEGSPLRGFGISLLGNNEGYGEGHDEVYLEIQEVLDHAIKVLPK